MNILVTGAAGFIGNALCKRLVHMGYNVVGIDNFNTVLHDNEIKFDRVNQQDIRLPRVEWMHLKEFPESSILEENNIDTVIHLAGRGSVRASFDDPLGYIEDNIVGTQHLIDACERTGVQKVLFASTSSVMANNTIVPWVESERIAHPNHPYAYSKYVNETQFKISKIPQTIGMRFFTVYGPWGRPDMALFKFTEAIVKDQPIPLFNKGKLKRDFTYIDDILDGIVILLEAKHSEKFDIFNIGRGMQVDLTKFVFCIEKELGRSAKIDLLDLPQGEALYTFSNTDKLKKLGYNPVVDIDEGVYNFVSWFKRYYGVN